MEEDFLQLFSSFTHFRIRGQITILIKKQLLNFQCQNYDSFDSGKQTRFASVHVYMTTSRCHNHTNERRKSSALYPTVAN